MDDFFCVKGVWKSWGEMTSAEKTYKKTCKIQIAEASGDKKMEDFWNSVEV